MATKPNKSSKPTKPATDVAKPSAPVAVIKVLRQPEKTFRPDTARALYWSRVVQYDGKPVAELSASVASTPPSQPKRGKLAGQTEPLKGWLSWFKAQGLIAIA